MPSVPPVVVKDSVPPLLVQIALALGVNPDGLVLGVFTVTRVVIAAVVPVHGLAVPSALM